LRRIDIVYHSSTAVAEEGSGTDVTVGRHKSNNPRTDNTEEESASNNNESKSESTSNFFFPTQLFQPQTTDYLFALPGSENFAQPLPPPHSLDACLNAKALMLI
jgi:hypothetical protein